MVRLPRQKLPQLSPANLREDLLYAVCRKTNATSTGSKRFLGYLKLSFACCSYLQLVNKILRLSDIHQEYKNLTKLSGEYSALSN